MISNPIEIAVLGGASTVFSIAGNPRTTQPPDAEKKPELSLLTGQSSGFLCRFERNAHKPFFICGYSFQNEPGFQRDGNSFGSGLSNRGESALLAYGYKFPWQWFPKAAALPWREESNGGQRP